MLQQLTIRHFAIIDDLTVDFQPGFLVMTGETGAGKSIIIEALGLLLGERANASMVRRGANKAFIEGVFTVSQRHRDSIETIIGPLEDDLLIVRRDVDSDGKSTIRLNGRLSTNSLVRPLMRLLVDIHSQHDNLYLADEKNHLGLLDQFAQNHVLEPLQTYQALYRSYREVQQQLVEAEKTHYSEEQLDFFRFQQSEIEAAHIRIGEMAELEAEKKRISQYETIARQVGTTLSFLKDEQGSLTTLYQAQKALQQLHNDPVFDGYANQLAENYHQLVAIVDGIEADFEKLQLDEQRIQEINDRLYLFSKLKRKYGSTEGDILAFYDHVTRQIELASDHEVVVQRLQKQLSDSHRHVVGAALKLRTARANAALELEKRIIAELRDLFLPRAVFKVRLTETREPTESGMDHIEFHVSVNPGQPTLAISKVASGGEISRLMLALKVIFNRLYGVTTTIFDEVDTGVSGEIASAIGKKMQSLATSGQVIAITHLPQVAASAPHHLHVVKEMSEQSTTTNVRLLQPSERIEVIAKMLSGTTITSAARQTAEQLLTTSHEFSKNR